MLACAVWSIACAMLRSPSRKSKSSQIFGECAYSSERRRRVWTGVVVVWWWCGGDMGWKGLLPKAYPQNVWMCKSPVCGIEAMRSSAERVEPLQKPAKARPGSRRHARLPCAPCSSPYHTSDCLERDSSRPSTQILLYLAVV